MDHMEVSYSCCKMLQLQGMHHEKICGVMRESITKETWKPGN